VLALFFPNHRGRSRIGNRALATAVLGSILAGGLTLPGAPPARAAGRPATATSYYLKTTATKTLNRMGCTFGQGATRGGQPRDALVVLAMGRPRHKPGHYGTSLFRDGFASTARIRDAGVAFAGGFRRCSSKNHRASLRIALGTSNYGRAVSYGHGRAWARMVNAANDVLAERGWSGQIDVVGANDIELLWNGPRTTKAWIRGYDAVNEWPYYDFGDAAGCPPYRWCAGAWTMEDVWYVAWGAAPAIPLPQIYTGSGISAKQWFRIGLYSEHRHGSHMAFAGVMSQQKACHQSHDPCRGMNNSPAQAWAQLNGLLNSRRETAQRLRWSTDIAWRRH
jgi:hypothetical protein